MAHSNSDGETHHLNARMVFKKGKHWHNCVADHSLNLIEHLRRSIFHFAFAACLKHYFRAHHDVAPSIDVCDVSLFHVLTSHS